MAPNRWSPNTPSGGGPGGVVSELKWPPKVVAGLTRKDGTHEEPFQASAVLSRPSKPALELTAKLSPPIDPDMGSGTIPLVAGNTLAQLIADVGVFNAWLQVCEKNGPVFPICIEQIIEVACAGTNAVTDTTDSR
jgi:hypothetical protein